MRRLFTEVFGTFAPVIVAAGADTIAVGSAIALCGLVGLSVSGASMNPARSLGSPLVGGATADWWIYVVGPMASAIVAVACTWMMHGGCKTQGVAMVLRGMCDPWPMASTVSSRVAGHPIAATLRSS